MAHPSQLPNEPNQNSVCRVLRLYQNLPNSGDLTFLKERTDVICHLVTVYGPVCLFTQATSHLSSKLAPAF